MALNRLIPSEAVIRHRGGHRDEDGKLSDSASTTLMAIAIAPGGGSDRADRSRSGEDIDCIVYFPLDTDILSDDELTVRGQRFQIVVNDWHIGSSTTGGIEVLCKRSQG